MACVEKPVRHLENAAGADARGAGVRGVGAVHHEESPGTDIQAKRRRAARVVALVQVDPRLGERKRAGRAVVHERGALGGGHAGDGGAGEAQGDGRCRVH